MKIVIYGTVSGRGGIQNHLYWMCKALVDENFSILIINPKITENEKIYFSDKVLKKIQIVTEDKYSTNYSKISSFKSILRIKKIIKEFSPDIFYKVGTGWMPIIQSFFLNGNVRKIFHEVMSATPNNSLDPRWGVKYVFDEIIGQSYIVAENFKKNFSSSRVIGAIPAIPEPLEVTANLPKAGKRIVKKGNIRAAFFSRLAPHKQGLWLVKQWNKLSEYIEELHIHGSGEEEKKIRDYIKEKGIGNQVKCFGWYPGGQKYVDLLVTYDITLLPTIGQEGAPLVLLESMACGVPFVANGVGGIPDYGIKNTNVIISKSDNSEFLEDVAKLSNKLSQGLINQNTLQEYYLKNYSFENMKFLWLNYFNDRVILTQK